MTTGQLHHVELWVPDIDRAVTEWGWLLTSLGYRSFQDWPGGRSWSHAGCYLVLEQSPDLVGDQHDRRRPGLNHLAFQVVGEDRVDELVAEAPQHGWTLLFAAAHPHAGGPDQYAGYLSNSDGYEVELVAVGPDAQAAPSAASTPST